MYPLDSYAQALSPSIYVRTMRGMKRSRSVAAYAGWEKRKEAEEAVTVNLAPEHLALWERTRGAFHGSPQARLERFEQYAHEHQGEEMAALQDAADDKLEAMLRSRDAA
jgi:hypothetical protein